MIELVLRFHDFFHFSGTIDCVTFQFAKVCVQFLISTVGTHEISLFLRIIHHLEISQVDFAFQALHTQRWLTHLHMIA